MNVLVVGIGAMGLAIAKALHKGGAHCVHVCGRRNGDEARALGMVVHSSLEVSEHAEHAYDVVLFAVKPKDMRAALNAARGLVRARESTVFSIAAGIATQSMAEALGEGRQPYPHVVRAMPTIAALVSKSITALSFGTGVSSADKQRAVELAQSFGSTMELAESLMDAFTGIAGSGIAFAAAFVEALTLGGVKEGLAYDQAYEAARKASAGALALLEASFASPAEAMAAIASAGGTTIAGIHALHAGSFHAAVINAVSAAATRSKNMQQ